MTASWRIPGRRPLVVAHRGSSCRAPENTLAAFHQAIADGADAVECDVRLTADGEVVVAHDASLGRTITGSGLVRRKTLDELRRESAGALYAHRFAHERVPTLEELLTEFAGRIAINIELKGSRGRRDRLLVRRTCELLAGCRADSLLISSFQHALVFEAKRIRPDLTAGLLLHGWQMMGRRVPARWRNVEYLICGGGGLRKRFVGRAHGNGFLLGEFTVNGERRLQRSVRYGIDAIITDDPRAATAFLK